MDILIQKDQHDALSDSDDMNNQNMEHALEIREGQSNIHICYFYLRIHLLTIKKFTLKISS